MLVRDLSLGMAVFWKDPSDSPDNIGCSAFGTVIGRLPDAGDNDECDNEDFVVSLKTVHGGEVECTACELERVDFGDLTEEQADRLRERAVSKLFDANLPGCDVSPVEGPITTDVIVVGELSHEAFVAVWVRVPRTPVTSRHEGVQPDADDGDVPIVVEVVSYTWGNDRKLGRAHVAEGPAYAKLHTDPGPLPDVCAALALAGHSFSVRQKIEPVSLLELVGFSASEVADYDRRLKQDD